MRVVLDTNVWISGLLWRGLPWRLLRLAEAGEIEPCMAPAMLEELAEVLAYPRLQPRLAELELTDSDLIAYVLSLASFYEPASSEPVIAADPDDDIFLHCAAIASADWVVSGDLHLLELGSYGRVTILTVRDFLAAHFPNASA